MAKKTVQKMTKIEQEAFDALKFCITHRRQPFMVDIAILLKLVKRLTRKS